MALKETVLRKEAVRRAKQRMLSGEYELAAAASPIVFREVTDENAENFAKIVKEIKDSKTFVMDPLRRLMDREYFETLSNDDKMGYLLELSKKYVEVLKIV